jgi:GNAT superfamily N-acetyltransferase
MLPAPIWQPFTTDALAAAEAIAEVIHPDMPERSEVFAEKIALAPATARVAVADGRIVGYAIAHPWRLGAIPKLDRFLERLPEAPDCIFVHDVALLPEARGHNLAATFIDHLRAEACARGIGALSCVSVYGTTVLWARLGFVIEARPDLAESLAGYGETARYMVAPV